MNHYGYVYEKDGVVYGPYEVTYGSDEASRKREALRISNRDGYWAVTWCYTPIDRDGDVDVSVD